MGQHRRAGCEHFGRDLQSYANDRWVHLTIENLVNAASPPPIISINGRIINQYITK
jgi:hypothetical protein